MASRKQSNLKALRKIYSPAELRAMGVTKARKKPKKRASSSGRRGSGGGGGGGRSRSSSRGACTLRACQALIRRKERERAGRASRKQAKALKRVTDKPELLRTTGGGYGGGGSSWGFTGRDHPGRRKKRGGRGGRKRGHGGFGGSRSMGRMGSRSRGRGWSRDHNGLRGRSSGRSSDWRDFDMRDWPGEPIRHKRAAVYGWQGRLRGRKPKNPTFFGHRPVRSSARKKNKSRGRKRGRGRRDFAAHDFDMRDWPGQPIRHKRAAALGWQRRLRGRKPKNPSFFGHRPVRSSMRKKSKKGRGRRDFAAHDFDMRDWPGEPIRHKRASVLGWQRRLRGRKPKNPTFFGHRPVRSSARRDSYRDSYRDY